MMCRTYISTNLTQDLFSQLKGTSLSFRPGPDFYYPCMDFNSLLSNVQFSETLHRNNDSRSRSELKVMGLSLKYRDIPISPLHLDGVSLNFCNMFAIVN